MREYGENTVFELSTNGNVIATARRKTGETKYRGIKFRTDCRVA